MSYFFQFFHTIAVWTGIIGASKDESDKPWLSKFSRTYLETMYRENFEQTADFLKIVRKSLWDQDLSSEDFSNLFTSTFKFNVYNIIDRIIDNGILLTWNQICNIYLRRLLLFKPDDYSENWEFDEGRDDNRRGSQDKFNNKESSENDNNQSTDNKIDKKNKVFEYKTIINNCYFGAKIDFNNLNVNIIRPIEMYLQKKYGITKKINITPKYIKHNKRDKKNEQIIYLYIYFFCLVFF